MIGVDISLTEKDKEPAGIGRKSEQVTLRHAEQRTNQATRVSHTDDPMSSLPIASSYREVACDARGNKTEQPFLCSVNDKALNHEYAIGIPKTDLPKR